MTLFRALAWGPRRFVDSLQVPSDWDLATPHLLEETGLVDLVWKLCADYAATGSPPCALLAPPYTAPPFPAPYKAEFEFIDTALNGINLGKNYEKSQVSTRN